MAPHVQVGARIPLTIPIFINTLVFLISSHNILKVYKGVHPVISPKLAAAGIYDKPSTAVAGKNDEEVNEDWIDVNGMPLPSFARLMRPLRKDSSRDTRSVCQGVRR
ncbi:hypothetical protein DM02DRAFT_653508 [Periconia macrospinosa]|uniref:Uncharacterized protein n=1 Tax=Periconia macrospinosa TaxID=97972 RepID=A0A2V1DVZ8_9PLEO|nr:hypothetical protein DM02DRAFT_653508 [Periconia macrospinosa]